jgi:hypothetical protein
MIKLITKLLSLKKTLVYIDNDRLTRRGGLFFRKTIELSNVFEIDCISRDALTHDELVVNFLTNGGEVFYISEFDIGFIDVINDLYSMFHGLINIEDLKFNGAFSLSSSVLWKS